MGKISPYDNWNDVSSEFALNPSINKTVFHFVTVIINAVLIKKRIRNRNKRQQTHFSKF